MDFAGFTDEGMALLEQLPTRDKEWFQENRPTYVRVLADPLKAFTAALGEELQARISGDLVVKPVTNGSISPINNDLRFRPDASPYKDHLMVSFWEGDTKKTAPTLRVRISVDECGYATGAAFDPATLALWRDAVAGGPGEELARHIAALVEAHEADVAGSELKRVPAPFEADHPLGDLLRHKWLQVRWPEPTPAAIGDGSFVDHCAQRLEECAPVHRWLCQYLGGGSR